MARQKRNHRFSKNNWKGNKGRGRKHIKTFDPRAVIGKEAAATYDTYEVRSKFSDLRISNKLKQSIDRRGYIIPTPIQDQAIPKILTGRDVVGIANTGTGKTAAFLIPLINKAIFDRRSKALIIAPTRELAVQIEKEFRLFCKNIRLNSVVCIGGVSIRPQIAMLQRRPNFVIGTPGRLIDLFNQKKINFADYDSIVLDEVDRMLDMGFIHDMQKIISQLPKRRQSLFFSATLDKKVEKIMHQFIYKPVMISVKTADASVNVHQDVIEIRGRNKVDVLSGILGKDTVSKTLVFTRTKRNADKLSKALSKIGHSTAVIHGNKSQNQRQRSLDSFRHDKVNILIATDVASRGIDINDITHVINYDLPESYDAYIHRIGRTGRADKKGSALTLVD